MNMNDAISAYRATQRGVAGTGGGMASRETESTGPSFGSLVKEAVQSAIVAQKHSAQVSDAAVKGKADMTDVVLAVNNAETTLQSVVAVRDKVVAAYQEIMRMPI
jgi:flagellar hook-basal body complex protein FliE